MDKKERQNMIETGETQTVEFKESLGLINEICEEVSAFSNTNNGLILVGITDKKEINGVQIGKKTIEDLANYIKTRTDNHVFPKISVVAIENKNIIIVDVKESHEKPVFFKGKAYKRVGKASHKLSASEIRNLAKESGNKVYWDEQVCEKAVLEDIDWNFVKEFFIPRYESLIKRKITGNDKELLEALGGIKDNKPTNAGMLLFGKDPGKFFMNSYIALARYKGKQEGIERLDYKEFSGNIFKQIDSCGEYITEHIAVMSRLHPYRVEREDIPEYPLFSIREIIINAACHRNYSEQRTKVIVKMFDDHIECYNPGGLAEEITPENITKKQFSRNPTIAKVLSKIGYIEELGEGWDKIIEEHKRHPLRPKMPGINADQYTMTVTLFSTKQKFEQEKIIELNERQKRIVEYVRVHKKITNKEYRILFPTVSSETARLDLKDLADKNILEKQGAKKGVFYRIKR
ncbi:MAG: putative DNA binding domain-containing protein [Candidatus Aenigmarchaeota archaeon]|nr:putative DNA binding domain-containing protein [Candidatus Aenigmarchaeota archaeon]